MQLATKFIATTMSMVVKVTAVTNNAFHAVTHSLRVGTSVLVTA